MSMEGAGAFGSGPFLFSGEVQSNLKRVFRRCSAMLLVALLAVGVFSVPASAAETSYKPSGFWDIYFRSQNPVYSLYRAVQTFLESLGKDPETATDEDWRQAYDDYVNDFKDKHGSSVIDDGGYLYFSLSHAKTLTCTNYNYWRYSCEHSSGETYPYGTINYVCGDTYSSISIRDFHTVSGNSWMVPGKFLFSSPAPVSGYYSLYSVPTLRGTYGTSSQSGLLYPEKNYRYPTLGEESYYSAGSAVEAELYAESPNYLSYGLLECAGSVIYRVRPTSGLIDVSINVDTRVGYLTNNYIYVEGDTNIVVENVQIVNETTNVYYNPVTGVSTPIINWQYDYGDRSYNLTLEGGVVVKVVFGPETVQINEGDTVYNVQYAVPDSGGGGEVDPTPTPTPPPDPDDGKDYTGILGSIWEAIKGIWESIKGLGKSIIDGIIGGLQSLFLPSEDSLNSFSGEVDEKLPIINDVQELGDQFVAAIENPAQAVNDLRMTTVVDLGQGGGQIAGNAQINLLDVSWYLEYKPLVDDVIVGFVWLVFLWNLFGQLPNIIHGGASALHTTSELRKEADYFSSRGSSD